MTAEAGGWCTGGWCTGGWMTAEAGGWCTGGWMTAEAKRGVCESVWGEWVPSPPTAAPTRQVAHGLVYFYTQLMRLRHWKTPPESQTVTAIPPRLRCSDSAGRLVGWSAGRLVGWSCSVGRWPLAVGGRRWGWGSISARVQYLGTPLTHSAIHQRTVSPIAPTPQLTKPLRHTTFSPCHWML